MNTESKQEWYDDAIKWEDEFVKKYGQKFGLIINPSKEKYKYSPDLYLLKSYQSAELKRINTPFFKSQSLYNIPPEFALSFNVSDLFEYLLYDFNMPIFIWVIFEDIINFGIKIEAKEEVYFTTTNEIKNIIKKENIVHKYGKRISDKSNEQQSFVIDLRKFKKII